MFQLDKKSIVVSRGYTYSYYTNPASEFPPDQPILLLAHGWPDDAGLWRHIAPAFSKYRVIIPDLLGVGDSSKPTHVAAYSFAYIARDFEEIFEHENVAKLIVIGHDWGSILVQRLYLYTPERIVGMITLNVPYNPPLDQPFDLDAVNAATKEALGYSLFGYWHTFCSEEGSKLMNEQPERVWQLCHTTKEEGMLEYFSDPKRFEGYLKGEEPEQTLREYARGELMDDFLKRVRRDGLHTWHNYYRAWRENVQYEAEKVFVPGERHIVRVPVLCIACSKDPVARPELIEQAKDSKWLPDMKVVTIEAAHWCTFENPRAVVKAITEFLEDRFV